MTEFLLLWSDVLYNVLYSVQCIALCKNKKLAALDRNIDIYVCIHNSIMPILLITGNPYHMYRRNKYEKGTDFNKENV